MKNFFFLPFLFFITNVSFASNTDVVVESAREVVTRSLQFKYRGSGVVNQRYAMIMPLVSSILSSPPSRDITYLKNYALCLMDVQDNGTLTRSDAEVRNCATQNIQGLSELECRHGEVYTTEFVRGKLRDICKTSQTQ